MAWVNRYFIGRRIPVLALFATAVVAGCDQGPPRYSVSGRLLYEEKTVPNGRLVFTPDRTAGNSGPQGVAKIEDGKIATEQNRKVVGGPHWVQILAFDGIPYEDGEGLVPHGRPLFPLAQAPIDLPKADAELEIRVAISNGKPEIAIEVQ